MELRPYQKEAASSIFDSWNTGIKKTLLVLPTGTGKTVVFAKVAEKCFGLKPLKKVICFIDEQKIIEI